MFGLTSSPFLLGGVLDYHLSSWQERKPEVIAELKKSLYVDDLVSGKPTIEEAKVMKEEAKKILGEAKFTLHKWHSNKQELEDAVVINDDETFAKEQLGSSKGEEASILGLSWSKREDKIKVVVPSDETACTKRGVLSKLAQIYDPLGILSPTTLQGKLIYREVC